MLKRITLAVFSLMPLLAVAQPPALVKVTPETKVSCVEFVSYKGEMYCTTKPTIQTPVDPKIKEYETQRIAFDDRPWQAAWGKNTPVIVTVEYVVLGDDINAWHELVTSQFMPGIQNKISPKQFAELSLDNIRQAGFKPMVTVYKDSPNQFLYEFRIETPSSQAQDELQLITRGANGFYSLHYVMKKADMGEENRKKWLDLLQKSQVK